MNLPDTSERRILVPVLAGIGNAVMAVPLVRALGRLCDGGGVTVAARTEAMAQVMSRLPEVERVEVLGSRMREAWRRHRRLAAERFDLCVVPFPSNRWQYVALLLSSGARRAVMHDYPVGRWRTGRILLGDRVTLVPAERGLHDVDQNLHLAEAAGAPASVIEDVKAPVFATTAEERQQAAVLVEGSEGYVAIQPGCGNTPVGTVKRWPAERFAALADELAGRGREVILLEGPDESGVGREVSRLSSSGPRAVELKGSLGVAAAVLERGALLVANDSGLAHVSAAAGTPAVTLFAAADPGRASPWGCRDLVVTPRPVDGRLWRPRLLYPMNHPGPRLRNDGIDWASHIRLEDVLEAVERGLASAGRRQTAAPEAAMR